MMQEQSSSPLQQTATRLRALLLDYDFEFAELLTGLAALGWGAWLLAPWWDTFGSSPSFAVFAFLGPEWAWGLLVLCLGALQLYALVRDIPNWRKTLCLLAVINWAFIATVFAVANLAATGTVIYPLLAFSAGWARLRLYLKYR